jgi:hypothetical protein
VVLQYLEHLGEMQYMINQCLAINEYVIHEHQYKFSHEWSKDGVH